LVGGRLGAVDVQDPIQVGGHNPRLATVLRSRPPSYLPLPTGIISSHTAHRSSYGYGLNGGFGAWSGGHRLDR
ncbi:MAG: hypothetical protein VX243_00740, partial [Actinomycetota bacterium]|nr:hypothetical protein [Actinomycetota bacterium]